MNAKGQIISLDFLISLVAITLAIGLLIQFSELKTYNEKEEVQWLELKAIAETASNLLVSNPEINCDVIDVRNSNVLFKLVNCVDTSKINNIPTSDVREKLGIPNGFGFSVKGGNQNEVDISNGTLGSKQSFAVKRIVVLNNGSVSKQNFEKGMFDPGQAEITLRVWRQ